MRFENVYKLAACLTIGLLIGFYIGFSSGLNAEDQVDNCEGPSFDNLFDNDWKGENEMVGSYDCLKNTSREVIVWQI